jgi:hypothetical protein
MSTYVLGTIGEVVLVNTRIVSLKNAARVLKWQRKQYEDIK